MDERDFQAMNKDAQSNLGRDAFDEIIDDFRDWNKDWYLFDTGKPIKKPKSRDEFKSYLRGKYAIGFTNYNEKN